ncbi:MAG TPA: hypothetical protein VFI76_02070, partial [Terrimicrobiaceae bacterium]|nr:hypothetical protein [Terrimicrobiaceae bacterium]
MSTPSVLDVSESLVSPASARATWRPIPSAASFEPVQFSARRETIPLKHYWSFCSAAGRANEGLRAGWREHLQMT